jgi:hypothetical protein
LSEENAAAFKVRVVGRSRAIGIGHPEEVHCRESALQLSKALRLRKLNHSDVELTGKDRDAAQAGCQSVDEQGALARNCWRGAWKSNPNLV